MFLPYFCTPFKKGKGELVAQLVEQYTFNVWALGSSPSQFTNKASHKRGLFLCPTAFKYQRLPAFPSINFPSFLQKYSQPSLQINFPPSLYKTPRLPGKKTSRLPFKKLPAFPAIKKKIR